MKEVYLVGFELKRIFTYRWNISKSWYDSTKFVAAVKGILGDDAEKTLDDF